jgi:DNA-binding CsgD family transcriptional regulator
MNDDPCRSFFLEPSDLLHRRYEVLRAFFVEGRPQADIAVQFGLTTATVQSLVRDFRAQVRAGQVPPFFDSPNWDVPPAKAPR